MGVAKISCTLLSSNIECRRGSFHVPVPGFIRSETLPGSWFDAGPPMGPLFSHLSVLIDVFFFHCISCASPEEQPNPLP